MGHRSIINPEKEAEIIWNNCKIHCTDYYSESFVSKTDTLKSESLHTKITWGWGTCL